MDIKKRSEDLSWYQNFKNFSSQSGEIFNLDRAAEILNLPNENVRKTLSRWAKQGLVFRLTQGFYAMIPIDSSKEEFLLDDPWVVIPALFDPCYVGGMSALEHWDLTDQIFNPLFIFTSKSLKQSRMLISGQLFVLKRIPEKQLFGLAPVWHKQSKIMISDIHRVIIDVFKDPEVGGGLQHSVECLRRYLNKPEVNLDRLLSDAKKMNSGAVFKRLGYLLSIYLGPSHAILSAFKKNLTAGYAYLDPKQKENVQLITEWRLWVPKNFSKLSNGDGA